MSPELAISIINYKTGALTIAAAQSVLEALGARDAHVVIVDNASGDGSAEQIADWIDGQDDPRVRLVRSEINGGFSAGHNLGMGAVPDARYYLVLNSDALLRPDFFDHLLETADRHPQAGLIAPQLEWEDGEVQTSAFRFARPLSELIRGSATGAVEKALKNYHVPLSIDSDPARIEWASFACILLRGEMVRALGPMDEGYFLYFEDEEYALRARRAGWQIVQDRRARAVHFRGGSGPVKELQAAKKRLPDYYYRSRTRFLRQISGPLGPVLGNLCWVLGRVIAHARLLAGRSVPTTHENEWRDIWIGVANPLRPDPRSPAGGAKT